jgi:anti-sigma factor (TIGR02949 family)
MTSVSRLTCEEMFRRLDDYLDRELDAAEMQRVREHLESCAACAREFAFEAEVLATVRAKLRRVDAPVALRDKVSRLLADERVRLDGS